MRLFTEIYALACERHGGTSAVEDMLPCPLSDKQLKATTDDRFLANMSRRVFQAGLKHEMVNEKWPAFELAFRRFDPLYCSMLSDDDIDQFMRSAEIIRHLNKIRSVRHNAAYLRERSLEHKGYGAFISQWPADDVVGLWWELKKHAKQLGGFSGAAFLRMVGKDTFLLTTDVIKGLQMEGVLQKAPTSKKDSELANLAFLQWRQESKRSLCQISKILALSLV